MSSSIRRGSLAATALALSLAVLTACGAGNNAETLKINPDNARVTAGDIRIQNAVVITQPEQADGPAAVSARIFNNGDRDQTLERLAVTESDTELELTGEDGRGNVVVPAGGSVMLGGEGNASAVLAAGHDGLHGTTEKLAFEFSGEGEVRLAAMVVAGDGDYESFAPTASPSPTETATGSPDAEPGEDAGAGTGDATDGTGDASASPGGTEETPVTEASSSAPATESPVAGQ